MKKINISYSFIVIVLSLIAFFYYGNCLSACFAVLLMGLLSVLLAGIGLVPFVGPILYWLIARLWLYPLLLSMAEINASWITTFIFWWNFVLSMVLCLFTSIVAVSSTTNASRKIFKRNKRNKK